MTPKYGAVAELSIGGSKPVRVMVLAPKVIRDFGRDYDGYSWAMILKGETIHDGAVRGPGYIGPVSNSGNWVRWLDDGA